MSLGFATCPPPRHKPSLTQPSKLLSCTVARSRTDLKETFIGLGSQSSVASPSISAMAMFRQLPSEVLISALKCAMLRTAFLSFIGVVCVCLCCCTNPSPPRTLPPSLPLANRVAKPDARKYATYSRMEWNEWKNPILVISTQGIEVLICHVAHRPKVKPESIGDVSEGTSPSDWPFGLIVMLETAGLDSGNPDQAEQNRTVLLRILKTNGIPFVWGPPSA